MLNHLINMIDAQSDFSLKGTFRDAFEAEEFCKISGVDLVLMDVQMPVMDGYTATKTIRLLKDEKLRRIPIVAMTANAFAEDVQNAKAAGMTDHIAKPLDVTKMMETLTEVLHESGH